MGAIRRGVHEIRIYRDLCKACGLCIHWCPQDVLAPDEDDFPITPNLESCINCKLCEWHCPDFAIEVIAPDVETANVDDLIHAR